VLKIENAQRNHFEKSEINYNNEKMKMLRTMSYYENKNQRTQSGNYTSKSMSN
jgi:hypothetical protein